MANCPYTTHEQRLTLAPSHLAVGTCLESCGRTFFVCPQCQEANRPLARYCRQCGNSISFVEAESKPENDRLPQRGIFENYKLAEFGITEVQALHSYKGYLIVVGDRSVLIFDVHKIHELLLRFQPPDGKIIRGITVASKVEDEQLLVTTSRSIYCLSLLDLKIDGVLVWEVKGANSYIAQPVIECGEHLYVLELDQSNESSRLVRLPDEEIVSFEGVTRPPLCLDRDGLFFFTHNQVFLYDTTHDELRQTRFPEQFAESNAAYSQQLELVYLVGENGLWRLDLAGNSLVPSSLLTSRNLSAPLVAARGENLFVTDSQGFIVMDPFGTTKWDSRQNFIRAVSDGLSPQLTYKYVMFTAQNENAGTDLRIQDQRNPSDFKTIVYNERLLCPPLLAFGRLLTATGGDSIVLNCMS